MGTYAMKSSGQRHRLTSIAAFLLILVLGGQPAQAELVSPKFHTYVSGSAGASCWYADEEASFSIPDIDVQDKRKKLVKKYGLATSCSLSNHPEVVASTVGKLTMGRIGGTTALSAPDGTASASVAAMFQDAVWPAAPGKVPGDTITYTAQLDVGALLDGYEAGRTCAYLSVGLSLWSPDGVVDTASFVPVSPFSGSKSLLVHVAKVINAEPLLLTVNTQMFSDAVGPGCTTALAGLTKDLQVRLSADVGNANTVSVNGVDYH